MANFLGAVPGVAYSFFAGALSDRYGRKPLFYLPMAGFFASALLDCVNYAFIRCVRACACVCVCACPTNLASVHLVMGCPNARIGIEIAKKKGNFSSNPEQPKF